MAMHYNLGRLFYQNFIGFLLFLICLLLPLSAQAMQNIKADPQLVKELEQASSGRADIAYHSKTGYVRFMGTDLQNPIPTGLPSDAAPEDAARTFLSTYGKLFGITNQKQELAVMREKTVDGNRSFVRFQQKHNGIPVLGGELAVQTDSGKNIISANGKVLPGLSVDVTPKISAAAAIEKAIAVVAKTHSIDASELSASSPELWIYNPIMLKPARDFNALVYRMDVTPNRLLPIRELVLVDAHTGIVALHFNQIADAKNRLTYTASNTTTLPGTLVCNESNPTCTGGDTHAVAAHTYAGHTYDFYFTNHGRDSINNAGMSLISTVHYNTNYANAFWSGTQMVYGDAYGFALADDVVAHELTHGVTDYESGLFYYYQSGAINESLSDVWGEFVDLTNGAGTDTLAVKWQIGEDVTGLGAIRSMSDPTLSPYNDPDRIGSTLYNCDTNELDNGGVHSNSGVNNKAAYLMVDGGTFNGYTVTGLGITKVAKIYYEAQTNLLLSASDYNDLYNALIQACNNLTGSGVTTAADCVEVTDAVNAVQMNQQPASCPANEASLCPTGAPNNLFFDNLENTASGNWTSGANSGANAWYYPQNSNPYGFDATYATSGQYNFWGYNQSTTADYYIRMNSNIPLPTGSTIYMHFNHAYGFDDDSLGAYDGGVLEYSTNNSSIWNDAASLFINNGYNGTISNLYGNPLGGRNAFVRESNGYYSSRLDLTSLAGQNVRFRFRIGTDISIDDYGWFIDNIRIYTCAAVTTIPTAPSGLTAIPISASQINLTWTDNSTNETGFRIERKIGATGTYSQIATVWADITSYSDTNLLASTTYYYRVTAYNAIGSSAYTNEANTTTWLSPPSNLTATAVSSSQIILSWTDNSTNETGFRIERSNSSSGPFSEIATVGVGVTTYSNTGLSASTTYYYRVRAYNTNNISAYSNISSATTSASSGGGDNGGGDAGGGGCGFIDDGRNNQPPFISMMILLLPLAWLLLRKLVLKRA